MLYHSGAPDPPFVANLGRERRRRMYALGHFAQELKRERIFLFESTVTHEKSRFLKINDSKRKQIFFLLLSFSHAYLRLLFGFGRDSRTRGITSAALANEAV
jgi:hypothetical protein